MTDGINGVTESNRVRRDETDFTHTDPAPARKTVTSLPVPPDGAAAASFGPLSAPTKSVAHSKGVTYIEPDRAPSPTDVQMRMDRFREAATPTFRAEGHDVTVPIAFRMTVDPDWVRHQPLSAGGYAAQERIVQNNDRELRAAAAKLGLLAEVPRLHQGRATPEVVRRVTQELIDQGRLPDACPGAPTLQLRIRMMMCDHGIGMDCAGYTGQTFLASRGLHRAQTKLGPIDQENLSNLEGKGFASVPIGRALPGDLVSFESLKRGQPGHRAIVYDHRDATHEELKALRLLPGFGRGRITVLVLDSSWGSGSAFAAGGVQRRTFWHSEESGRWAERSVAGDAPAAFAVRERDELYADHRLVGAYRHRQETQGAR
jgi:hypothetical protein